MKRVDAASFRFADVVRPGDTVLWGQVCGEPLGLTKWLLEQRHEIGRFSIVMGLRMSQSITPAHADVIDLFALNAGGRNRALAKAGVLDMLPMHVSRIEPALRTGDLPCDVVLVQVSRPNDAGEYSLGLIGDYINTAVDKARVVIAEINHRLPWVHCDRPLTEADIDFAIETDNALEEVDSSTPSTTDIQIAQHAAAFIDDGATLQMGIGGTPEAIMALIKDRRRLGVHSGLVSESLVDLVECGAVTNEMKTIDRGVSVSGSLMGTDRLYRFCDRNPAIRLAPISYTHAMSVVGRLPNLIAINSALEIDLTGQVNAEAIGSDYLGGVGGQVDFVRAANASEGGRALMVLPSLTQKHGSRLVSQLSGPVTTARADLDLVITEHGVAQLRGKSLRQRVRALIAIAHPEHRETLEREAHGLIKRQPGATA